MQCFPSWLLEGTAFPFFLTGLLSMLLRQILPNGTYLWSSIAGFAGNREGVIATGNTERSNNPREVGTEFAMAAADKAAGAPGAPFFCSGALPAIIQDLHHHDEAAGRGQKMASPEEYAAVRLPRGLGVARDGLLGDAQSLCTRSNSPARLRIAYWKSSLECHAAVAEPV